MATQKTGLAKVGAQAARFDPVVERYTERYLELRRQAFRANVDVAIELGQIVTEVERRVGGGMRAWLKRVGTTASTAYNQQALARLAEEQPEIIQRWKELGPSKLYKIARLPRPARRIVLRLEAETLQRATDREFARIVAPHVVRKRKVTPAMRGVGLGNKLAAFTDDVRAARVGGIEDAALRETLRKRIDALVAALGRLRKTI